MDKNILKFIRKKIDKIDRRILELLSERAKYVLKIGEYKKDTGEEFYLPYREKKIILELMKSNKGPIPNNAIEQIYMEILHACRSLQKTIKVAYLGPEAAFTHLAAIKNFGKYTIFIPVKTISDVFLEVEKKRCDYGVVPIENSTEGIVNHTFDMFLESDLKICSELNLPIVHCLLSKSNKINKIKKLYSHPQALAQCRNWLETNMSNVTIIESSSTSEAAKLAAKDKTSASISSELASELYHLKILVKGIEDSKENYTRFLIIGENYSIQKSGHDKTSIMISIKDRIGALHDILLPFKKYNVNLTKIESRPTKQKAWEYVFFIDFLGHVDDSNVKKVLKEIEPACVLLKILGSYPRAE